MDNNDWDLFAIVRSCKASTFTPHATILETPPLPPTPTTTTNTTTNNIISHQKVTSSYFDNFTFANRNSLNSFATTTIPIPTTTIPTSTIPIIITNTTSFPITTISALSTTTVPEKITTPNELTELEKLKQNFNRNTIIPIPTTTSHTFNFTTQTTNNTTITPIYTTTPFITPTLTSTVRTPITTTIAPTTIAIPTIIINTTTSPTITTTTPKKFTTTTTTSMTNPIYTTTTFTTPTILTPTTTKSTPSTTIIPTIITNTKSSPATIIPTISTTAIPTYITTTTTNTITNINNNVHNSNQSTPFFNIPALIKQQNELIGIEKLKLNFNQSTTIPIPTTTFRAFNITNPNPTNTTNIPIYTNMTFTTPISTIRTQTTTTATPTTTTIPTIITNTASSSITAIPTLSTTTTTTTNTITNAHTSVHYSNQSSTFVDFPTLIEQQLMQLNELKELNKFELDFNSNTIIPMPKTTIDTFNITTPTTITAITPIYTTTTFTTPTPTSTICTPKTTLGTPAMNSTNINVQGTNQYPTIFQFPIPIKQQIQPNNNNQVFVPKHATCIKITTAHFDSAYNHSPVQQQPPQESNQLSLVPQIDSQVLSNTHLQQPKHKSRKRKHNDYMRFEGYMNVEKPKEGSWTWRKYGQKSICGSPHPRSYYKCSFRDCPARKQVQKTITKENTYVVTYDREHNHEKPTDNLNSVIASSRNKSSQTRLPTTGEAESSPNVGNFHSPDVAMLQFDQPESSNARVLTGQSNFPYPESRLHAGGEARSFSNVRNIGSPNVMTLKSNELESNNGHVFSGESSDTKFTGNLYDDCDILIEKMETMFEDFLLDFNNLMAMFP